MPRTRAPLRRPSVDSATAGDVTRWHVELRSQATRCRMRREGVSMRRSAILAVIAITTMVGAATGVPAQALTVTRRTTVLELTTRWRCPGADPVEHYTLTFHDTVFERAGVRTRVISHAAWRGIITSRSTGDPVRDTGNW